MLKLSLIVFCLLFACVFSSHFRGATISWSPGDKDGEVSAKVQKQPRPEAVPFTSVPDQSCC